MDRLELIRSREYWVEMIEHTTKKGFTDIELADTIASKMEEAINYSQCCTEFICHSCNEKKSGQNDDQLHEVCKDCFSGI